jgi:oligopeptide transport system ATP-binding protein
LSDNLLEINDLFKHFPIKKGILFQHTVGSVKAVDGISFSLKPGKTFGLVGESGCGKTTTGLLVLRLLEATSGRILFEGKNILNLPDEEMRGLRRDMQMIFQDPYASLNPRMTVGEYIGEPLEIHGIATGTEKDKKVRKLLDTVQLNAYAARKYPHEFSGGQRQRVGIARALSLNPKLIVCDEPVSALDVSIQAQIINLLQDLQKEFHLTYLFISHDLSVVKHISNRVAVMYLGNIVETARKADLYSHPEHPYTEALLSAVPMANPLKKKQRIILEGDVPTPIDPPDGCKLHTRCRYVRQICTETRPALAEIREGHFVMCHFSRSKRETGQSSV